MSHSASSQDVTGRAPAAALRGTTRRGLGLRAAAAAAGGLAAAVAACGRQAPAAQGPTGRPASFDWRNFGGQTIRHVDQGAAANQFFASQVAAFEKLTGIKVEYEMVRDQDVRVKTLVALTAGDTSIDVFGSATVQDGVRFLRAGFYAPLDQFIRDRSLTAPDFDLKDFLEGPLAAGKVLPDNVLVGLPQMPAASLLYYNKSLFDRNGVSYPRGTAWRWKDLEENLTRLHRPEQDAWGLLMRHDPAGAIAHWSIFLHDRGGTWFERDGKVSVSTPLALEALEHYGRLLRRLGPPELQQSKRFNVLGEFQAGKVGSILEQSAFAPQLLDRTRSAVADYVGFAGIPAGPKGSAPIINSWVSAVSALSKRKEAAWYWVQWHTSKEVALRLGLEAGLPPSRKSAWEHPDFKARQKNPALDQVVLEMFKQPLAHNDWLPPVVNVVEARPIAGKPIEVAIQGGDFRAAAREATVQLRQIADIAGGR